MTNGPTLHTIVEADRIESLIDHTIESIDREANRAHIVRRTETIRMAREAYRAGLLDGFQQGVLAADGITFAEPVEYPDQPVEYPDQHDTEHDEHEPQVWREPAFPGSAT